MPRLRHNESSPRKQRSASIEVARDFIDGWQAAHPDGAVDVPGVWFEPMPEFDGAVLDAKYAGTAGTPPSDGQAERLLISAPMCVSSAIRQSTATADATRLIEALLRRRVRLGGSDLRSPRLTPGFRREASHLLRSAR